MTCSKFLLGKLHIFAFSFTSLCQNIVMVRKYHRTLIFIHYFTQIFPIEMKIYTFFFKSPHLKHKNNPKGGLVIFKSYGIVGSKLFLSILETKIKKWPALSSVWANFICFACFLLLFVGIFVMVWKYYCTLIFIYYFTQIFTINAKCTHLKNK